MLHSVISNIVDSRVYQNETKNRWKCQTLYLVSLIGLRPYWGHHLEGFNLRKSTSALIFCLKYSILSTLLFSKIAKLQGHKEAITGCQAMKGNRQTDSSNTKDTHNEILSVFVYQMHLQDFAWGFCRRHLLKVSCRGSEPGTMSLGGKLHITPSLSLYIYFSFSFQKG